jgi:hypothetical protein
LTVKYSTLINFPVKYFMGNKHMKIFFKIQTQENLKNIFL